MTLIEVMIALVILMVVALASMQIALVGMSMNLQNSLRDAAVNIADQQMSAVREWPFDSIVSNATLSPSPVTLTFRGASVSFAPVLNPVTSIDSNTKQATVTVTWPFKGQTYTHSISTIVRRQ